MLHPRLKPLAYVGLRPGLALNGPMEVGETVCDKAGSEFGLAVFERIIKEKGLDREKSLTTCARLCWLKPVLQVEAGDPFEVLVVECSQSQSMPPGYGCDQEVQGWLWFAHSS